MKRYFERDQIMRVILSGSVVAILLCVSFSAAELVTPRSAKRNRVCRLIACALQRYFQKRETARVIGSGGGDTCLALYVFDGSGNCVAFDDRTEASTGDDLYTEWIPAEPGALTSKSAMPALTPTRFVLPCVN